MKSKLNLKSKKHLALRLKTSENDLLRILKNFDSLCREHNITTKKGKLRNVVKADSQLKVLHKSILKMLYTLWIHDAAHGWRKGRTIISNAKPHCGNCAKLCLDLKKCFPNTHSSKVRQLFENELGCSPEVSNILTRLTTYKFILPQGFSTSGAIINLIFRKLDLDLSKIADNSSLKYTRYGDDITFSGTYISQCIYSKIKNTIQSFGLILNDDKEEFTHGDKNPIITGLNTSGTKVKVPRKFIKNIRAAVHQLEKCDDAKQSEKLLNSIQGRKAFIISIAKNS